MYQVIARKYRPQTFADVVSQEHVKTTLENAITQKRIAHGYIFSGQRGTGKTTIARIKARFRLNCVKRADGASAGASCKEISVGGSVDVIEIDAASNRGIDNMRSCGRTCGTGRSATATKFSSLMKRTKLPRKHSTRAEETIEEPPEQEVHAVHHGSPQDSGDNRVAVPAFQFPVGGF